MNKVGWLSLMGFSFALGYWLGITVDLMSKKFRIEQNTLSELKNTLALHSELTSNRCQCNTQTQNRKEKK